MDASGHHRERESRGGAFWKMIFLFGQLFLWLIKKAPAVKRILCPLDDRCFLLRWQA